MVETDGGGARYSDGKPRFDLLPPDVLTEWAKVMAHGAAKYGHEPGGARNWERGMRWGECYRATHSHLMKFWMGRDMDEDSGLPHLVHAFWNIGVLLAYELRGIGIDDRNVLKPGTHVPTEGTGGK